MHGSKNDRLDALREAFNALNEELKEERAARLRILRYLDVKEVSGPIIVPVATD